jgi:DNA-binding CsgD family transcriptional regulator
MNLLGRRTECEVFERLIDAARSGRSAALALHGEPGIGKTALLEYAVAAAHDLRVVRVAGVESEMELAFAGLHQLCAPFLDRVDRLPGPQADALGAAFGLIAGSTADRFLIGLAVLSLLSEAAADRPLLSVVDDAQWLDQASSQTLGFVARRLLAESVAMVFATREPTPDFSGLEQLALGGLPEREAQELLESVVTGPLDPGVRDRIIAEAHGNPLALLELPRGRSSVELAGGFGLPSPLPLAGRIEHTFLKRLETLPEPTQLLLLVAAAEPVGDPALLWRVTARLGISREALNPAERAGMVELGAHLRFRHPLVRSAIYRAASDVDRRRVHSALAELTDPNVDPDRRAWHRAEATPDPDEDVAAELEASAGRAQARGGLAAAAAFLERSVGLTPDPTLRTERALAAAQAKHQAGDPDAALGLLGVARAGPLDELGEARVDLLSAQITYAQHRGSEAPPLLLRAAKRLENLDGALARETYLEALFAAEFAGHLARGGGIAEIARAALAGPKRPGEATPADLLLDGVATRFAHGYPAGAPMLKRAVSAFRTQKMSPEEELRWLWLASTTAVMLWDDESWNWLAARHLQLARDTGALTALHLALSARIGAHVFAGELASASSLIEELRAVTDAIGGQLPPYSPLLYAALRGREAEATELIAATLRDASMRGEGQGLAAAESARALLLNSLGRYEEALRAAELGSEHPEERLFSNIGLVEAVVAAARSGAKKRAGKALDRLTEMTRASGTNWALGIEARSRALLSEGAEAGGLYREAIERLSSTRVRFELARAHLHYGEWLRRERRRLDARAQLRIAHEMFLAMRLKAFAASAERELLATGERARKRVAETREDLTAQETQIAGLARDGLSNAEIGARLFISPRTVEYHLHKVFNKLGITSRSHLDRALARRLGPALVAHSFVARAG